MTVAYLPVPADSLKMLRETLCRLQIHASAADDVAQLGHLLVAIDLNRPLGPDGKHRDLHTNTCGCDEAPANITPDQDCGHRDSFGRRCIIHRGHQGIHEDDEGYGWETDD